MNVEDTTGGPLEHDDRFGVLPLVAQFRGKDPFVRLAKAKHALQGSGSGTAFARYARCMLECVDADALKRPSDEMQLSYAFIERTSSFFANYDSSELSAAEMRAARVLESVLNRLVNMAAHLNDEHESGPHDLSMSFCAELDAAEYVVHPLSSAVACRTRFAHASNRWGECGEVACEPGGDWDVRTRLAMAIERMSFPVHLDYGFRYHVRDHCLYVRFAIPWSDEMRQFRVDSDTDSVRSVSRAILENEADEFSRRMALAFVEACFAASPSIAKCYIEGVEPKTRSSAFVVRVDRGSYERDLSVLALNVLMEPLEGAPCLGVMGDYSVPVSDVPVDDMSLFVDPAHDMRALPHDLSELLLADRSCELEVLEDGDDTYEKRLLAARKRFELDPAGAIEILEDMVDDLSAHVAMAELVAPGATRPQFFESYIARLVEPMLEERTDVRLTCVPDALFCSEVELTGAYMAAGDEDRALAEAQRLFDMASTSARAHSLLINVLMRLERYDEALQTIRHGLSLSWESSSISYYLYRGAYALWHTGDPEGARACYSLVSRGSEVGGVAQIELDVLCQEHHFEGRMPFAEALECARRHGMPTPPTVEMSKRIFALAIRLTDSGFYFLASVCTSYICKVLGWDEMMQVAESLMPVR